MKKYATAFTFVVTTLSFASMSWADNTGEDAENDVLHGHGAGTASKGQVYVQAEARTGDIGTDVLSYPQDFESGSPSSPAEPSIGQHDDHADTLHAISKH